MSKLVDVSGKEMGVDQSERIKALEVRIATVESALVLHGTFLTILKRFFDAIPGAARMRKSTVEENAGSDAGGEDKGNAVVAESTGEGK